MWEAVTYHPIGMIKAIMGGIAAKIANKQQRNIMKRGFTFTSSNVFEAKHKTSASFDGKDSKIDSGCKEYFLKKMYEDRF